MKCSNPQVIVAYEVGNLANMLANFFEKIGIQEGNLHSIGEFHKKTNYFEHLQIFFKLSALHI